MQENVQKSTATQGLTAITDKLESACVRCTTELYLGFRV